MIPLEHISSHMIVARGVENASAGAERFGLSAGVVLSDEEMEGLEVPKGVQYLMILAERTNSSQAAAFALATRMEKFGKRAVVYVPKHHLEWFEAAEDKFNGEPF